MCGLIVPFVPHPAEQSLKRHLRIGIVQLIESQLPYGIKGDEPVAFRREGHRADGGVIVRKFEPGLLGSRMVKKNLSLGVRRDKSLDPMRGRKGGHRRIMRSERMHLC